MTTQELDAQTIIRRYINYLKLEKGLSANSVDAYTHDLNILIEYLNANSIGITDLTLPHLDRLVVQMAENGLSARSRARVISGIKSFYKFLIYSDIIERTLPNFWKCPKAPNICPKCSP